MSDALRSTPRTQSQTLDGRAPSRLGDFEGMHYSRVGQARARQAAICSSDLDAQCRLLLLILAETQKNGCCPIGPETWEPSLGVGHEEAELLIKQFTAVGLLTEDSDLYCLHVHGRAVNKGAGGRQTYCGKQASTGRRDRVTRPRSKGFQPLVRTGRPFCPPGLRQPLVVTCSS